jgi:hypothetical protein
MKHRIYSAVLNVKVMKIVGIPGMLQYFSFSVCKQSESDLVISVTIKGPTHFGSSFLETSVRGLHSSTRSLALMVFCFTFLSLQTLVSFW